MKRNPFITYLFGSACMLGSCTTAVVDEPDIQDSAINFTTPETRAAIDKELPEGSSFKIWGYRTSTSKPGEAITDFNGETVTKQGKQCNYTGGTRYWIPGYTYNFYALYPFYPTESQNGETTASCDANGNLTVANFDCSKTGAEAVDLMTAKQAGIDGTNPPLSVGLMFNHLLSRVQIVAKTAGALATVHSVSFSGVQTQGSYDSSNPSPWRLEGTTSFKKEKDIHLTEGGISLFGDMLLIPQPVLAEGENPFEIQISYMVDGGEMLNKKIRLSNATVKRWMAGESYRYTLTILPNDEIEFDGVTVEEWGDQDITLE